MDFEKYIAFGISFISLLIQQFTKISKGDSLTNFSKSTSTGKFLVFLSLLAFGFGVIQTIDGDNKSKRKSKSAESKRIEDSILLSRRWEYDTSKFKELLDSSKEIIENSITTIERGNRSLLLTEKLLEKAISQQNLLMETRVEVEKGKYPLPESVTFKFYIEYVIDTISENQLFVYFESNTNKKEISPLLERDESIKKNTTGFYDLDYSSLDKQKIKVIDNIVFYMLGCHFNFYKKSEPIFKLRSNYLYKNQDKEIDDFKKNIALSYNSIEKKVFISCRNEALFNTDQERKLGTNSLLDLENSILLLHTTSLFFDDSLLPDVVLNKMRLKLRLLLKFGAKEIFFPNLYPLLPSEDPEIYKKFNIGAYGPAFFDFEISKERIDGALKSLR